MYLGAFDVRYQTDARGAFNVYVVAERPSETDLRDLVLRDSHLFEHHLDAHLHRADGELYLADVFLRQVDWMFFVRQEQAHHAAFAAPEPCHEALVAAFFRVFEAPAFIYDPFV